MKKQFPRIALLAALAVPPLQAGLIDALVGKPEFNVITVTDMTPAGRLRSSPTPQAPAYYAAATKGFVNLGGGEAGQKKIPEAEATRAIAQVLAGQGYRPATASSPAPTLLLVFSWGMLNPEYESGLSVEDRTNRVSDLPDLPDRQVNQEQLLRFLGGEKWAAHDPSPVDRFAPSAREGHYLDYESRKFHGFAEVELYIVIVSAYDLKAAQAQKKELLWVTRIACPAAGFSLSGALPAMLAIAAPNFGRETARPVWVNASDKYTPQVKINDLQVLEYLEKARRPEPEPPANQTSAKPTKR